jgi:hypothetical protein
MNVDHGPDCYACTDPAGAARQIAEERTDLDAEAAAAVELRAAGERLAAEYPRPSDLSADDWQAVQDVVRARLEIANVAACSVRFARAHLNRVEAAHPALHREAAA